jgi:biotin-[acetyl-CoA-carboxylase] ligase BirA-like protein
MSNRIISRELGEFHTVFDVTDSTMNDMNDYIAKAIEEEHDIHGHVIQALQQTNGRGSTDLKTGLTREWKSQEGNLLFSMAVSIKDLHNREVYLIGVLAVFETIKNLNLSYKTLRMEIPNDIYIDDRKVCGVLTHDDFCFGDWCNMGIGANTAFAPKVTDGRNVSGCLADYGWPRDKKPEEFLSQFLSEFEKHYQAQLKDYDYVFKSLGLMNEEGLIYAYSKDNAYQWAVGKFKGFKTNQKGHDFILIEDANRELHHFLFLRTEILNPDKALQHYDPVFVVANNKGHHHG